MRQTAQKGHPSPFSEPELGMHLDDRQDVAVRVQEGRVRTERPPYGVHNELYVLVYEPAAGIVRRIHTEHRPDVTMYTLSSSDPSSRIPSISL